MADDFSQLHQQFRGKILAYLTSLAGPDEAEDLCQETFLKVERALPSFRGEAQPATWIYRIATNLFLDRQRSAAFKQKKCESASFEGLAEQLPEQMAGDNEPVAKVDQQVIRAEMNACIRGYIDQLPDPYRTALLLSDVEGFSNREIAEILQISLDNVKIRLHRARRMIKESLKNHCDFYHDERSELSCDRKQKDNPDT